VLFAEAKSLSNGSRCLLRRRKDLKTGRGAKSGGEEFKNRSRGNKPTYFKKNRKFSLNFTFRETIYWR